MKVLFFTEEYPPYIRGGAGVYAYYITRELANYCDLTVVTINKPAYRYFGFSKSFKVDTNMDIVRVPFVNIPTLRFSSMGFNIWKCFKNKLEDFDLVHSNSALLFMIKHKIPKIETIHNVTKELIETEKFDSLSNTLDILFYSRIRDFLQRRSFSNTNHFIVPSQYGKNSISKFYQIGEEKISVIPNGVDFDVFRPRDKLSVRRRLGIPQDKKVLLFVGRLEAVKRVDTLIETMKFLDDNIILIICGAGSKFPKLLATKRKLGLNNVLFAGQIDHDIIPLYYNAADLYVHTSTMESFGIILLESMASGTVVMASNTTGLKDVMQNGKIGYVLPKTPIEIADLIKQVLYDDKKLNEEREKGLKYVKESYSWEKVAHSTFDVYKKMLKSKVMSSSTHSMKKITKYDSVILPKATNLRFQYDRV